MSEIMESESLTSAVFQPLVDRISSSPISEFIRRLKLDNMSLDDFKNNLLSLGAILDDAELEAYGNKQVKKWVDELSEVSYDVKGLLDEISMKPLRVKTPFRFLLKFFAKSIPLEIKQRLRAIAEKMEDLRKQGDELVLRNLHRRTWEASQIRRELSQQSVGREEFEDESQVFGRDEDKEAILKLLFSDDDHQPHVITMVGEGGVGKTTLAQLVYNDERVKRHFDFKTWIHVSKDFDDLLLTKAILHAFTYPSDTEDLDSLQNSLKDHLKMKKFLLVLDNLCMRSDWRNLQKVLTDGANGSRIIVTTCHPQLEETMVGTPPAFTVRSLTDEESWMLFAKHDFRNANHYDLVYFRKNIVEKCHGLPLAVKILASVLRFKRVEEWDALLNWDEKDPITSILKMSYNDLPIHLKRCVAYCSIFPMHHEYEEEKLILLWMAQGFLQPEGGTRMEEVGSEYFRNLIGRSFFQPSGSNKSCFIMHDLLKDVIHSESGFICSRMGNDEYSEVSSRPWHLLISGGKDIAERSKEAKFLRTLILRKSSREKESCQFSGEQLNNLIEALQYLRVLSLSGYDITQLPDSIGKLQRLRFLDLSHTAITQLSDSVSSLHNLQTLLLSNCSRLTGLPDSLRNLRNLQFLDLSHTAITQLPASVNLRTLLLSNCSCLTELPNSFDNLSNLQFLDLSHTAITELPGSLLNLRNLQILDLSHTTITELPDSLLNLSNLQLLDLSHTTITELPDSLLNLSNLQLLDLSHTAITELPDSLLNLSNLQLLDLSHTAITKLPAGVSSLYSLQTLLLSNCSCLTEFPDFKSNLLSLDAILDDAELKAYENKHVKTWVDELSEVSYDVKGLLDEISKKLPSFKSWFQVNFSAKSIPLEKIIKQRLRAIAVKIKDLQTTGEALGLREDSQIIREPSQLSVGREDFEDESQVFGRDEDKEAILKLLFSDDDHQTHVITMVGEGGVGKTTLAQLVYNDERVKRHFDFKTWIHVSEDFDDLLLTKAILHAFTDHQSHTEDLDSLRNNLEHHLNRTKFLLVLDNLCMRSDLRNLQKVLTDGERGSRIIVTCHPQLEETMAGTLHAYTVRLLTKEESWMLFAKHAFPDKSSGLLPKLEDTGKEIVEKCRGLPLLVKILASVLRFKHEVKEWQALLNNINSILNCHEDPITSILKMCYHDLPIHLKRCVACSICPMHHEYEEEKLILLWMAQGFLQPEGGTRMEEVGSEYFRNLIGRSFFQPSGSNKSCFIMHDLLKDVIHSESGFICSRMGNDEYSEVSSRPWHLLISGGKDIAERSKEAKFLRTLILRKSSREKESCQFSGEQLNNLIEALQYLRVLSLSGYDITQLPDSIGKLQRLRFLDLSHTAITQLSDSVSSLHNLQTLLLSNCSRLTGLPDSLRNLRNLQFLDLSHTAITQLPASVNLRTLLLSNCSCLTELPNSFDNLSNLQFLDLSHTAITDLPASVGSLCKLQKLLLSHCTRLTGLPDSLLRNLGNLQFLDLSHTAITQLPASVRLYDLRKLLLSNCSCLTGLPDSLRNSRKLRFLDLSHTAITKLPDSFDDLRNLQFLDLSHTTITKLPDRIGDLQNLHKLLLSHCTHLTELPYSFRHLRKLQFLDLSDTAITVIPFNSLAKLQKLLLSNCSSLTELPDSLFSLKFLRFIDISQTAITKLPDFHPNLQIVLHEVEGRKLVCISERPKLGKFPNMGNTQLRDYNDKLAGVPDVSITSKFPPPESSKRLTEDSSAKHGGASAATEISSSDTDNPIDAEESLEDIETSKSPPPESTKHLTEDSSAKHGGASAATEISSSDIDNPIDAEESLEDIETSKSPPPESTKHLTEDSSAKHGGASAATEISSSDTDNPIDAEESLEDIETSKSPPPESTKHLTEGLSAKHGGASAATEISSSDTDNPIDAEESLEDIETSKSPPPESTKHLTEGLSAKHGGASAATEISSSDTDNPIDAEESLEDIETSKSPPPESTKHLTEGSSAKHGGASAATEISSSDTVTDDPIDAEEMLEDISSPEQESLDVSEISQLKRLPPKLYSLKIEGCDALKSLHGKLKRDNPYLQHLYIIDCQFLKSIHESHLPNALKTLYISKSKKLELEFLSSEYTSIEHLCIESSCDSLESFRLSSFPKLRNLAIRDCANFTSISIGLDHMSLDALEIRDCPKLTSFLERGLSIPNLTSILLSNCKNLKELPDQLHRLTSLQSLFMKECPQLESIPGGLPSSLNLLCISSCHKLTPCVDWGLHKLNSFSCIEIEGGCRDLESFPEQNLLPMNLTSLRISRLMNLKFLDYKGLEHLTSLETLKINSCGKLQSFPAERLPSSLSYLYISDCPLLKSKLQNRRGKEWYKIDHIPHIQIN